MCAPGAPPKQSYLRMSVGVPSGCSPGIPYVLEIWPSGHFSPVHNHGNAFGIVRILHGSVTGDAALSQDPPNSLALAACKPATLIHFIIPLHVACALLARALPS